MIDKKQKICVIGAGVIGITTAYLLSKKGYEVFILERDTSVGKGTSFANGAQISLSNAIPWSSPQSLWLLLGSLLGFKKGIFFSPHLSLEQWLWGIKFLYNCQSKIAQQHLNLMLDLCRRSQISYKALLDEFPQEFDYFNQHGILHFYTKHNEYDKAKRMYNSWGKALMPYCKEVTVAELLAIEPKLTSLKDKIVGGFYAPDDMVVDTHRFCQSLLERCQQQGAEIHYRANVQQLIPNDNNVVITTNDNEFCADYVVCCLGIQSNQLLRSIGIKLPIYPVKGYSITVDANDQVPYTSMLDQTNKIVMSRFGNTLRISGIAEISGYNTDISEQRIEILLNWVKDLFPHIDLTNAEKWVGLRPMTPSNLPYVCQSRYSRVWLNCGHGSLGLTTAMGSAEKVACDILTIPN